MLSFNAYLDEKKSQIKVNPRKADLYEKEDCSCDDTKPKKSVCKGCMGAGMKGGETCTACEGKGYTMESEGEGGEGAAEGVAEAKKDDTYLEPDMKKRQKNNEKARKDLMKGPQMKNPHFESTNQEEHAYVSTEESAEEVQKEDIGESALNVLKDELVEAAFDMYVEARRGPQKPGTEERAAAAKKSLDAVKKRQKVLDKHEKKTGKKLDISKSPEHKQHKMRFPGSKRTGKKVKGEKETELQQHNRRVSKHNDRLIKKGPTKKEAERQKGYDAYEKKHKRGNRSVWD